MFSKYLLGPRKEISGTFFKTQVSLLKSFFSRFNLFATGNRQAAKKGSGK
jgi:hypothetical protein